MAPDCIYYVRIRTSTSTILGIPMDLRRVSSEKASLGKQRSAHDGVGRGGDGTGRGDRHPRLPTPTDGRHQHQRPTCEPRIRHALLLQLCVSVPRLDSPPARRWPLLPLTDSRRRCNPNPPVPPSPSPPSVGSPSLTRRLQATAASATRASSSASPSPRSAAAAATQGSPTLVVQKRPS